MPRPKKVATLDIGSAYLNADRGDKSGLWTMSSRVVHDLCEGTCGEVSKGCEGAHDMIIPV
jgi:hypothetical protein